MSRVCRVSEAESFTYIARPSPIAPPHPINIPVEMTPSHNCVAVLSTIEFKLQYYPNQSSLSASGLSKQAARFSIAELLDAFLPPITNLPGWPGSKVHHTFLSMTYAFLDNTFLSGAGVVSRGKMTLNAINPVTLYAAFDWRRTLTSVSAQIPWFGGLSGLIEYVRFAPLLDGTNAKYLRICNHLHLASASHGKSLRHSW
jgi:hypothetical protein